ncbi:MAG: SIMPL domain-containing protein [Candidatus Chisholmbacteria bacterium]|nr:SIMPL domain-containing protein [Candidatus Chisholmbacteria bacterium]
MPTQKLIRPVGLVVSFFLLLGIYTKLVGPIEFRINQISTQKAATFDVSGEGTATAVPDQAEITLGITATATTVAAAQQQANQVINSVTRALKDSGVGESDIKTQNYSINPNYDYQSGTNKITGYTISVNLLVKFTDFDRLNQAIDAAVSLGANQIGGITFTLSDPTKAKAEDQARDEAVKEAKRKAEGLSQAAGIKLGRIVNIFENPTYPEPPIYTLEAKAEPVPAAPTQLEPGTTEIKLTITLSYETL